MSTEPRDDARDIVVIAFQPAGWLQGRVGRRVAAPAIPAAPLSREWCEKNGAVWFRADYGVTTGTGEDGDGTRTE